MGDVCAARAELVASRTWRRTSNSKSPASLALQHLNQMSFSSFLLGAAVASGTYLYTRRRVYENAAATQAKVEAIRAEAVPESAPPLPALVVPPLPGEPEARQLWGAAKDAVRGYWNRGVLTVSDELNKKLRG